MSETFSVHDKLVNTIDRPLYGVAYGRQHVVKGIGAIGLAGLDHAHEQVADFGPPGRAIMQTVLAMEDGSLEQALGDVMPTAGLCRVADANCEFSA